MVKRDVATAGFATATPIPVAKKVSPERMHLNETSHRCHRHGTTPKQLQPFVSTPPSPDTLIGVEEVPPLVEHPHDEVYLHNSAAIRLGIEKRKQKKLSELSSDEVQERLCLPFKTIRDPCKTQFRALPAATTEHDHYAFSMYHGPDAEDFAATSESMQTHKFQSVQLATEDFHLMLRHMNKNGVPAASQLYKYKPADTPVMTTTGERRPVNTILRVKDVIQTMRDLKSVLDRFLFDFAEEVD